MASLALLTTTIILLGSTDATVIFGRKVRFGRSVHNRDVSPLLTRMRSAGAKVGETTSTAVTLPSSSSVQGDRLLGKEAADEDTAIITSEVTDDAVNLMLEQSMPMIDVMSLIDMSLSLSMSMPDMPDIIFPEPGTGPVLPPISTEFDLATLFVEALVSVNLCCVVVSFLSNSQSHALCSLVASIPSLLCFPDGRHHPMCRRGASQGLMPNDRYHGVHVRRCHWR